MKKTVDSQRNVSLPPNSFYKFSLPSRTMAPTLRQRNKALEQVDVNKNTGTGSTTSRTAKKMKVPTIVTSNKSCNTKMEQLDVTMLH